MTVAKHQLSRFLGLLAALALSVLLGACGAQGIDTAGLAGSASMQIDVEVYKGPLSKELEVQKSELVAKLNESQVAVEELVGQTKIAMCALACFDRASEGQSYKYYPVIEEDRDNENYVTDQDLGEDDDPVFGPYTKPQVFGPDKTVLRHDDAESFCAGKIFDVKIERTDDEQHDVCPVLDTMEFDLRSIKGRGQLLNLYQIEEVYSDSAAKDKKCVSIGRSQYTCFVDKSRKSNVPNWDDPQEATKFLLDAANYAEFLHSRAAFFATQQTAIAPKSKRARRAIANFTQFLADYGNQIGARVDAILKQEALFQSDDINENLARELLANTTYLRDSAPTGFLNLYKFNDASAESTRGGATDRIRLVEQLTADTYWTRINSVFAAGQGDTTLAFIKDDIGNWDLKKFDNRPGELVDAYKQAGLAALQEVASLASGGATKVGQASQLLSFADRLNFGGSVASNAEVDAQVARLRERTAGRLTALKTSEQARFDKLKQTIETAQVELGKTQTLVDGLDSAAKKSQSDLGLAEATAKEESEKLAALEGEKRGLEDALSAAGNDQRPVIEGKIATVDSKITVQRGVLKNAQGAVEVQKQQNKLNQDALTVGNEKLGKEKAALAALENQRAVLPSETVRFARQILDNYLATLEELAETSAGATAGIPSVSKIPSEEKPPAVVEPPAAPVTPAVPVAPVVPEA